LRGGGTVTTERFHRTGSVDFRRLLYTEFDVLRRRCGLLIDEARCIACAAAYRTGINPVKCIGSSGCDCRADRCAGRTFDNVSAGGCVCAIRGGDEARYFPCANRVISSSVGKNYVVVVNVVRYCV